MVPRINAARWCARLQGNGTLALAVDAVEQWMQRMQVRCSEWQRCSGMMQVRCSGCSGAVQSCIVVLHRYVASFWQWGTVGGVAMQWAAVGGVQWGVVHTANHRWAARARWKKCAAWLADPLTGNRLAVACCLAEPALRVLGSFFSRARLGTELAKSSVMAFSSPQSSPATEAINVLFGLLRDPGNFRWLAVLGTRGDWTPEYAHDVATLSLTLAGNIHMRCSTPYEGFPWVLCRAVHPATPADEVESIVTAWQNVRQCCVPPSDGLSLPLRQSRGSEQELWSPEVRRLLTDIFHMCDASNIRTEDKFARARRHQLGKSPAPATICANHTIAEFASLYRVAKDKPGA